jgi:hypothetical protein
MGKCQHQKDRSGIMEYWNDGIMRNPKDFSQSKFQCSIIPFFL